MDYKRGILYGLLSWAVVFIVSMILYSIKFSHLAFFESILGILITLVGISFTIFYLKKADSPKINDGIILGLLFFLINIIMDLNMFMYGPMAMNIVKYFLDIGITYLIYPIISCGMFYIYLSK